MSEDEWLALVRLMALTAGWLTYHTHRSERSEPGWPDLVLAKRQRVAFVELKTDARTSKVTKAQAEWLDALALAGQLCAVWRPAMRAEVGIYLGRRAGAIPGRWGT